MKKILLLLSILILSACTLETEVVESLDPPEIIEEKDYDTTLLETAEDGEITTTTNTTEDTTINKTETNTAYVKQIAEYEEQIKEANETILSLQKTLEQVRNQKNQQPDVLYEFLLDYFNKVEQREYAFDSCGPVSNYSSTPWFSNFKNVLASKDIYLANQKRALVASDFFGACRSNNAQVIVFLGAENEFHAVKYNFATGELRETVLAEGSCSDCPVQFAKRNGPYIELLGENNTSYRFYFDKNVIINSQNLL